VPAFLNENSFQNNIINPAGLLKKQKAKDKNCFAFCFFNARYIWNNLFVGG